MNTHEVVRIRTQKTAAIIIQIRQQKGNITLRFSAILVYLLAIPLRRSPCCLWHVRTARSYAESEITSLIPQVPSSFPSYVVCTASDRKLGGAWEQEYSFSTKFETVPSYVTLLIRRTPYYNPSPCIRLNTLDHTAWWLSEVARDHWLNG